MELAKKYRWVWIGFVVMVLLNIGTLTTIWVIHSNNRRDRNPIERRENMQHFLNRSLQLSPRQRQAFHSLRQKHFRESRQLMQQIGELRNQYYQLLTSDNTVDSLSADSIAAKIGHRQARFERALYDHLAHLRSQLDEDQKPEFDRLMRRMLDHPRMGNRFGRQLK